MELFTQILGLTPQQGLASFVIAGLVVAVIYLVRETRRLDREIRRLNEARVQEAMKLSEIIAENTSAMERVREVMQLFVSMQAGRG